MSEYNNATVKPLSCERDASGLFKLPSAAPSGRAVGSVIECNCMKPIKNKLKQKYLDMNGSYWRMLRRCHSDVPALPRNPAWWAATEKLFCLFGFSVHAFIYIQNKLLLVFLRKTKRVFLFPWRGASPPCLLRAAGVGRPKRCSSQIQLFLR